MLINHDIQSSTAMFRHNLGEMFNVQAISPFAAFGLIQGSVGRERMQATISYRVHQETEPGRAIDEVFRLGGIWHYPI